MPDLTWADVAVRLAVAAVLGGAVGAERELREREAGFRTHLLVSVGAALFTLVSAYAWTDWAFSTPRGLVFDPTRIAAQIVTGIGFLGAGAIIRQGLSIRGLTTAATLWVVAAIGMAAGAGYYWAAVATTVLVLVSLWPLRIVAHSVFTRLRTAEGRLTVDLRPATGAGPVVAALEGAGARLRGLQFEDAEGRRRVVADVEVGGDATPEGLVAVLMEADDVLAAAWAE
ncbi:MAG: MgtC/SapB family protein [Actinomycetota bacterium]|nr:MgtC/SapB family protein [Actinomycetota bacterium]